MLALSVIGLASCSEETIPQVTIPTGSTNYFVESINFDHTASTKVVSFDCNVPWKVSVDATRDGSSWCSVSPASGDAGHVSIIVEATENTTYDDRNAVVRLAYGDSVKTIVVNQKQLDALTLTTDRFEVGVEGGTIDVEVKSNINYEVIIPDEYQEWIHQNTSSRSRALQANTLSFAIDASQEYDKREGQIIVKSGDRSETVHVYQVGSGILTLTKKEFNLSSSAQDITIEVNSNFEYSVELPNVDWLKEVTASSRAVSTHTLRLHVDENNEYDGRSTSLRLYDKNSSLTETVIINQSQKNALLIDAHEFVFDENGGSFTVNTQSNVDYSIKIDDSWVTESKGAGSRGLVSASHTFQVAKYTGNLNRSTNVTFYNQANGRKSVVVVKQQPKLFFSATSVTLMEGSTKTLTLYNRTSEAVTMTSSNTSVVTVTESGILTAKAKGSATITAKTTDGKYSCTCNITVKDITDDISAACIGGSIMSINGLIKYGSSISWKFSNNSSEKVTLKSMQLIGGNGIVGNEMTVGKDVAAGTSVSYSTSIGLAGIYAPVTCKFRFTYNGKEYSVTATYNL